MSKCIGCGVKLQSTNPDKPGYVKEIVLIENGDDVYCKRCHEIIHRNKKYDVVEDISGYYEKIKNIKNTKSLILLLVDIFDINNGFIPKLSEYIGRLWWPGGLNLIMWPYVTLEPQYQRRLFKGR